MNLWFSSHRTLKLNETSINRCLVYYSFFGFFLKIKENIKIIFGAFKECME